MKTIVVKLSAFILILASLMGMNACFSEPVRKLTMVDREKVEYIAVFTDYEGPMKDVPETSHAIILAYLEMATPFRNSISDSVYGEDYIGIKVKTVETTVYYFVYRDWLGRTLVEVPYNAIYRVNSKLYDTLYDFVN